MSETPIQKLDPDEKPEGNQQESIFANEEVTLKGYDKSLKNARTLLYVVAILQVGMGVFEYFKYQDYDEDIRLLAMGIDIAIGLPFLILAIWSYKKPLPAFLTALILYPVIIVGFTIWNPENLTSGIVLKIIVIVALWKAYKDAKENEELKKSFGRED